MYHIKRKVRYSNGRKTIMVGYDITDDNDSIIETFVSEGRMEEYARMNRQERKRKEVNKMNTNIRDIDKVRRIEDIGFCYDDDLKYSAKLFIYFDKETGKKIKSKCFYFLAGSFYRNQMESLIDRMTAQEFDNYLEYPRYTRFRFVPAHIESI